MKTTRKEEVLMDTLISISCDVCKRETDDLMEMQEFISIDTVGGYGSTIFGDGTRIELDICENCLLDKVGNWIRTTTHYAF